VLLEVSDDKLQHAVPVGAAAPVGASPLQVMGYPFGAGTIAEREQAERLGREYPFWKNGDVVEPTPARDFQNAAEENGCIIFTGNGETRPGMSGGGIFDDRGNFVGIHRSKTDAALSWKAVSGTAIQRWLKDRRGLEFIATSITDDGRRDPGSLWLRVLLFFLVLAICLAAYYFCGANEPIQLNLRVKRIARPVKGLEIGFEFETESLREGQTAKAITDENGRAVISVALPRGRQNPAELKGRLVCLNAPESLAELEPLVLDPHGKTENDHKWGDPLDLLNPSRNFSVVSLDEIHLALIQKELAGNTGKNSNLFIDLPKAILDAGLDEKSGSLAVESWVKRLKDTRPVLPVTDLEGNFSADQARALSSFANSVGLIKTDSGTAVGTGFVVASNQLLVPSFVINDRERFTVEFNDLGVAIEEVVWTSPELAISLARFSGPSREALALNSADLGAQLVGRDVAVIGFPYVDVRLPAERGRDKVCHDRGNTKCHRKEPRSRLRSPA
jgi:Trypsin-like peptidase domain